jgi:hypothetical protein
VGGGDGSEIPLKLNDWVSQHRQAGENALILELPIIKLDVVMPVIELELKDQHTLSAKNQT